ncbi:hypothetical protein ACFLYU_04245 [Candidatus Dependentiae bacterium]
MDFFKNNAFGKNLKPYQKALSTLFAILLIWAIWFFFIYTKIEKKITLKKNVLHKIVEKKQQLKTTKNKCKKITNKIQRIKSDMNSYAPKKDPKTEIIDYAKSSGISLKSYTTTENKHKASYKFTGNINQALEFCKKLKRCKKPLECQEASIAKKENNACDIKCVLQFLDLKSKH